MKEYTIDYGLCVRGVLGCGWDLKVAFQIDSESGINFVKIGAFHSQARSLGMSKRDSYRWRKFAAWFDIVHSGRESAELHKLV